MPHEKQLGARPEVSGVRLPCLNALIQPAFPGGQVQEATPALGGLSNTNYRLTVSGRETPVGLRIYVTRPESARLELATSERVRHRIPVPEFLFLRGIESGHGASVCHHRVA